MEWWRYLLRHFKNCITYLESNKSWGGKKEEKKQYHQEVVTSYYITDNKNECHVCSTIIANKGKQNQKCTIILLVWSFYGYFLTKLLRNFYVDIFFLVSMFNSYLQIVKIRKRHVRLHKNPSNNSVLLFKNFFWIWKLSWEKDCMIMKNFFSISFEE